MLTWYAIEIIVRDRILEERKEMMTRLALREAFRDQGNRFSLFQKLLCRLRIFLDGIRFLKGNSPKPIVLSLENNPCREAN
jgi:hypothetical protein